MLDRRVMIHAHTPFHILMGFQRLPAVAQPGFAQSFPASLP